MFRLPVIYTNAPATAGRQLVGVEAVIDNDLASALLATIITLDASGLEVGAAP